MKIILTQYGRITRYTTLKINKDKENLKNIYEVEDNPNLYHNQPTKCALNLTQTQSFQRIEWIQENNYYKIFQDLKCMKKIKSKSFFQRNLSSNKTIQAYPQPPNKIRKIYLNVKKLNKKEKDFIPILHAAKILRRVYKWDIILSHTWITDEDLKRLMKGVSQQKLVAYINLNFNQNYLQINDSGIKIICLGLNKLPKLQGISLNFGFGSNCMSWKGVNTISQTLLAKKDKIQQFSLNLAVGHKFGFKAAQKLSEALPNLKSLKKFNLGLEFGNYLNSKSIGFLTSGFKQMKQLTALNLNFAENIIKNVGIQSFCASFSFLSELRVLDLNFSNSILSDDCTLYIKELLIKLNKLENFGLNLCGEENHITSKGASIISEGIEFLTRLISLKINFSWGKNCIKDEGLIKLTKSISKNYNLQQLEISASDNQITYQGLKILIESLHKLSKLQTLVLRFLYNEFPEDSLKELSLNCFNLEKLDHLELYLPRHSEALENHIINQLSLKKNLKYTKLEFVVHGNQQKASRVVEIKE